MWYPTVIVVIILALLLYITSIISKKTNSTDSNEVIYYGLKESILTKAEIHFYNSLRLYVQKNTIILSKVSLNDLFYIKKGVGKDYMKYFNKIAKKHVDFLICDSDTLAPLYAIELDDSSHNSSKRKERDIFVDKLYNHAGLELIHIKVKFEYTKQDFAIIPINNKSSLNYM